jgi:membrane protein YdbS with pleckstrin-like domain
MLTFFTSTQYSFEGKKTGEIVAIFLHRHWFTITVKLVLIIVMILLPILLYPFIEQLLQNYVPISATLFVYTVYYMIVWSFFIYTVTMYLLDSWVVTNERILNNTQHGFFNRTVSEMELSRIQDVTVFVEGFIPTILNFGNVEIQTAGKEEKFIFEQIPNPQRIKDAIMKIVSGMKNESIENQHPV